jgi:8-oxo-dGTP pyrophosphatase MutT (NUDIX family)
MKIHYTAGGILKDTKKNKIYLISNLKKTAYQFPKGHIENNESAKETAIREVQEETGYQNIEISNTKGYSSHYKFKDPTHRGLQEKYVIYYPMILLDYEWKHTEYMDNEHIHGEWVDYNKVLTTLTFPNLKMIFKEYMTRDI